MMQAPEDGPSDSVVFWVSASAHCYHDHLPKQSILISGVVVQITQFGIECTIV